MLVIGPLTAVGFEERGTIQEVREFMDQVAEFRRRTGRRLTDRLRPPREQGGHGLRAPSRASATRSCTPRSTLAATTSLEIEKARWASRWHKAS